MQTTRLRYPTERVQLLLVPNRGDVVEFGFNV
jgi:hypothetical protein